MAGHAAMMAMEALNQALSILQGAGIDDNLLVAKQAALQFAMVSHFSTDAGCG